MKQEPVAWTDDLWNIFLNDEYCMLDDDMKKDMIPLYTAPRELSDEEIDDSTKQFFNIHSEAKLSEQFKIKLYELEDFARAILKKASEK